MSLSPGSNLQAISLAPLAYAIHLGDLSGLAME